MNERNYGIDLLRLFSMFLVAVLHVLLLSGSLTSSGMRYSLAWGMEVLAYCAVDCYGLISGYVGYREEVRPISYRRFPSLWLQIFTYSFGVTLLGHLLRPDLVGLSNLWRAALPVATSQYWFVSAYVGLFFLMPWLNRLLASLSGREADRLGRVLLVVYVFYGTAAGYFSDPFKLQTGYSFVWLLLLYLLGGWMKKCRLAEKLPTLPLVLAMVAAAAVSWLSKVLLPGSNLAEALVRYTSVTVFVMAFGLVILFSRLRPGPLARQCVAAFSPAAFGVYLIHVHPVIWNHLLAQKLLWVAQVRLRWFVPAVLGCAGAVFVVCLLVEKLRLLLFRWCKIDTALARLSRWLDRRREKA